MSNSDSFGSDYIKRIQKIWELNQPPLIKNADKESFYSIFKHQYEKTKELSIKNSSFIRENITPILNSNDVLTKDQEQTIQALRDKLVNLDNLELMDYFLCLKLTEKLILNAHKTNNVDKIITYHDKFIHLLYHLCEVFRRDDSKLSRKLQNKYKETALYYIERLSPYLELNKFSKLTLQNKNAILALNRIKSLFYYPDYSNIKESVHERLMHAYNAFLITQNKNYIELNPDFDWDKEEECCVYYTAICSTIIYINNDVYPEDLKILEDICELQKKNILSGKYQTYVTLPEAEQMISYISYLKKELSPKKYIQLISADYYERDINRYDVAGINDNIYRPVLILEVLVNHLDIPENVSYMQEIYKNLMDYSLNMPNNEFQELFLIYMLLALNCFREIEGGIKFADISRTLLANCSPATYVHSKMVGKISQVIGEYLINTKPDFFTGLLDTKNTTDVINKKYELSLLIYDCGIYHDFGKLPYLDTIGITYRPLFDDEFDIIKLHPISGYNLLKKYKSTEIFANIALGHHKWYDDTKGYPDEYSRYNCKYPILTDIIAVADCLDAATDIIFRCYNKGITLYDYIKEAREWSGSRYSPEVVAAFNDANVCKKIEDILTYGRDEAYITAYKIR